MNREFYNIVKLTMQRIGPCGKFLGISELGWSVGDGLWLMVWGLWPYRVVGLPNTRLRALWCVVGFGGTVLCMVRLWRGYGKLQSGSPNGRSAELIEITRSQI
jgi:hypothetical protein